MTEPIDKIIASLPLTSRGELAEIKGKSKRTIVAPAQYLSDVEPNDHRVLPPTYRNYYDRLKIKDAQAAQEFWDKWAFDPRPKPSDPFELEKRVLSRVGQVNTLKRRV